MGIFNFFGRKPKVENLSLQRIIPKCKEWKIDTLFVTTNSACPACKQYNRKIYSLYGWNKTFPKYPEFLYQRKCPACQNCIGVNIHMPGINKIPK